MNGLAHITGGGLIENAPRVFAGSPGSLRLRIDPAAWEPPPIFGLLESKGIERAEMFRVFNMGIGMIAVVPPYFRSAAVRRLRRAGYEGGVIGVVEEGRGALVIEGV